MKKAILFLIVIISITGCCLSQIPHQYVYMDENCTAIIPDYQPLVIVDDNCEIAVIDQVPFPGAVIVNTTAVQITAIDVSGNQSSVSFNVVLLDTIAPTIQLDTTWTGYTDREVGDMFRTVFGWVQIKGVEFNSVLPFDEWPMSEIDSMKVFTCSIPIPSEIHREWWWGVNYPE